MAEKLAGKKAAILAADGFEQVELTKPRAALDEAGARTTLVSIKPGNKPVAAICHAPWVLIDASVIRDRTVTSWPAIKTDVRNAGAN